MTEKNYSFLNTTFPVLNKGYIFVNDLMGDDLSIVNAARVSYKKGTKKVKDDRALIRYLIRHKHTSPLEHCEISFTVKCPIFIARQWLRHRTANVNEMSLRYSEATDDFFVPEANTLRTQSITNKQGRSNEKLDEANADIVRAVFNYNNEDSYKWYQDLLEKGIARELARCVLPVSLYTEFVWKIDLHNLLHFISLRADEEHAQHEIVEYAKIIRNIVKEWVPLAYEAFDDYVLNAITFSKQELLLLKSQMTSNAVVMNENISKNEYTEFLSKLTKMGNL